MCVRNSIYKGSVMTDSPVAWRFHLRWGKHLQQFAWKTATGLPSPTPQATALF